MASKSTVPSQNNGVLLSEQETGKSRQIYQSQLMEI